MRTFKIMAANPGQEAHRLWKLVAVEEDGSETALETYNSVAEAEAAKLILERHEVGDTAAPPLA